MRETGVRKVAVWVLFGLSMLLIASLGAFAVTRNDDYLYLLVLLGGLGYATIIIGCVFGRDADV